MAMIERALKAAVEENLRYFSAVTVTGPRQSGKTTLIREMFPDKPYFSLENPDTLDYALTDPVSFLGQYPDGMVLDEVQNAPQLLSYLQGVIDSRREARYILSGSSQFNLLKSVTQSLAGRTAMLELLPLSLEEIAPATMSVDRLLTTGFYPAIHAGENIPRLFYPAYVSTYLERDVRQLQAVKDLRQFQTFVRLCAGRIGSIFNASELSGEVGIAVNTVKAWLSILQASYIVFLLPPYHSNTKTRLVKSPKLYFYDVGLASYLLRIDGEEQMRTNRMRGHLFENMVIADCVKRLANGGKTADLMFYRDSHGNETDLLIPDGDRLTAVEIKSSQTYNSSFEQGLTRLKERLGDTLGRRVVVYDGQLERRDAEIELLNYRSFLRGNN